MGLGIPAPQPMRAVDYPAIRRLSQSLGRHAEPELWGNGERQLVIKNLDGQLLGWSRAHWWEPADATAPAGYYLAGIEVDRGCRHRGVGRSLTEARLDWIAQRASSAWCVVNAQNAASLALHRSLGFEEVAQAAQLGTVVFSGGSGVLLSKDLVSSRSAAKAQV
ncbi:aminoglycoside 6'-N-acetyltransferase I [Glutamicibacter mysorens]|uniref:Aminoglycoside 6'-N-acetyltransferase I n=1 Tax=Glutamicibacter mysorens TaxID=257984 RepID=A0ABX4MX60_9MICC|nr:GNAT family N-acetyltransferase [Glutamicibacter mysorens]PJJ44165.1 aminoglycoside 6'-N-acetyltransferase I [Glutamicibacter mysorens]